MNWIVYLGQDLCGGHLSVARKLTRLENNFTIKSIDLINRKYKKL